jgi:hypothetical protein
MKKIQILLYFIIIIWWNPHLLQTPNAENINFAMEIQSTLHASERFEVKEKRKFKSLKAMCGVIRRISAS